MRAALAALALLFFSSFSSAPRAAETETDLRQAKAYVAEVRRHLLQSYLEREKLSGASLTAAGLKALHAGLEEFPDARRALAEEETLDGALEAVVREAPGANLTELADRVVRAMVEETGDPFCRVLTADDMSRLVKMMSGGSKEIQAGLMVKPVKEGVEVVYVQASTPADEEDVHVGDLITRVGERDVAGLSPEEASRLLVMKPSSTLELSARRGGRPLRFLLRAPRKSPPNVRAQDLGQGVAYVRLTMFDGSAVREVRAALDRLAKGGSVKGLIFDLRRNPGGALPASTGLADLFLPQKLLIAKTVCHYTPTIGGMKFPGLTPPAEYITKESSPYEKMPMVCLVDGGSASASELLAGALKDHRRATLVGAKTYGKGVGQSPIVLNSMFMRRYLYLTVLRYTTPDGHEVNHIGVAPDVEAAGRSLDPALWDARGELRRGGALERWLDERWGPAVLKAADYDGFDSARWEGFEAFYEGLKTPLPKDVVREELRRVARRRAIEEGADWACDLQADEVLLKGLDVLLDRMGK